MSVLAARCRSRFVFQPRLRLSKRFGFDAIALNRVSHPRRFEGRVQIQVVAVIEKISA